MPSKWGYLELQREEYAEKRAAGLCVIYGCENKSGPFARCKACRERRNAQVRERGEGRAERERRRTQKRESRRKRAAELHEAGVCMGCKDEPLHSETLGEECLRRMRARNEAARRAAGVASTAARCSSCGAAGHYYVTCTQRPCDLRLEDFALARPREAA